MKTIDVICRLNSRSVFYPNEFAHVNIDETTISQLIKYLLQLDFDEVMIGGGRTLKPLESLPDWCEEALDENGGFYLLEGPIHRYFTPKYDAPISDLSLSAYGNSAEFRFYDETFGEVFSDPINITQLYQAMYGDKTGRIE